MSWSYLYFMDALDRRCHVCVCTWFPPSQTLVESSYTQTLCDREHSTAVASFYRITLFSLSLSQKKNLFIFVVRVHCSQFIRLFALLLLLLATAVFEFPSARSGYDRIKRRFRYSIRNGPNDLAAMIIKKNKTERMERNWIWPGCVWQLLASQHTHEQLHNIQSPAHISPILPSLSFSLSLGRNAIGDQSAFIAYCVHGFLLSSAINIPITPTKVVNGRIITRRYGENCWLLLIINIIYGLFFVVVVWFGIDIRW